MQVKLVAITIFLLVFSGFQLKAQNFDPFNGNAQQFHVQLDRYFPSREAESSERAVLLKQVNNFISHNNWKPSTIKSRLQVYEQLMVKVQRHEAYYKIIRLSNTKDTAASATENLMSNTGDRLTAGVEQDLKLMRKADLKKYVPASFSYFVNQALQKEQKLSANDLKLISELTDPLLDGLVNRYDSLLDSIKPPPATAKSAAAYYQAYSNHKEVFAATLIDITRCGIARAHAYGFRNATTEKYQNNLQNSEDSVRALLIALESKSNTLKDYQDLLIQHYKQQNGQIVHSWQLNAAAKDVPEVQSFDQSKSIILQSLKPLGTDYVNHFSWLLDPKNGALEIAGGNNRAGGGTSISYPQVPTSFYMKRFNGDLQSMLTMIHEGGHAIHRKLMGESLSVPTYASGPHFLFESFAIFNELLLFDRLIDSAKTIQAKSYYTKRLTDFLAHEIFTSAEEASFEHALNDNVATGKVSNGNDIDDIYSGIMNKYDVFFQQEPERHSEWIQRSLFFEDPLYNVNYLYAILVACKFYNIAHHNPQLFAKNYNALLRNGFDDSADHLLKKYMGFNLGHQDLLNGAIELMNKEIVNLHDFYN